MDGDLLHFSHEINILEQMLQELSITIPDLAIPTIVMVGSQSSGKSTFVNQLCGFQLSKTGVGMTTKAPLHIYLKNSPILKITVEGKDFNSSDDVQDYITKCADDKVKRGDIISSNPVNIKIESPTVCNICIVDLPGLIAVPKHDNQDVLIDRINNIVLQYISKPNIITALMIQAGTDLETNIALALIKSKNKYFERCIGILTKADLTDSNIDVDSLNQGVFKMEYGYHPIASNKPNLITNLIKYLHDILISKIKENYTLYLNHIMQIKKTLQQKLVELGEPISDTYEHKMSAIFRTINQIYTVINNDIENYMCTNNENVGYLFKKSTNDFVTNIEELKPQYYDDEYLDRIIKNINGYHMDNYVSIIKIIEICMNQNALLELNDITSKYIDNLVNNIISRIDVLCNSQQNMKFNKLHTSLMQTIIMYIRHLKDSTLNATKDFMEYNSSYVWSKDKIDNTPLHTYNVYEIYKTKPQSNSANNIGNNFINNYNMIRNAFGDYFNSIKSIYIAMVPKIAMHHIIRTLQNNLSGYLINSVNSGTFECVNESEEIVQQRQNIIHILERFNAIILGKNDASIQNKNK